MKILVLGAGGIGGYFGARLVQAGADVTFLVRPRRRDQLARDGLVIESKLGDARLEVKTVLSGELAAEYDLILLTCKAFDLPGAIEAIQPGLAPNGAVLPMLNGISHMDVLNATFGKQRVLGGIAVIQVTLTDTGIVQQFNDWCAITFGEQDGALSGRVRQLEAYFKQAPGVNASAVDNIMQHMWEKVVLLATAATMTCLMRANVGEILRTPDGHAQLLGMLDIARGIAASNGFPPRESVMNTYRATFSDRNSTYSTSMLRDVQRGNRTEYDHIVGFMLERSRAAGLDDTVLALAYTNLKSYEGRRR